MKISLLIVLVVRVLCDGFLLSENPLKQTWSKAFENVTRHLFQLETRMFIKNYGVDSDTINSLVLKNLHENAMPFQLRNLQLDQDKVFLDSSALITFKNFDFVKNFNQKLILTNEYFKPLQLFVFCQNVTIKEIECLKADVAERAKNNKITEIIFSIGDKKEAEFNSYLLDIIQYEYFLVEEENYIKLLTFLWFSPVKCGELTLIEVNKFDKITKKWNNDKFSMKKMKNLYGCTIVYEKEPIEPFTTSMLDFAVEFIFNENFNANLITRSGEMQFDLIQSKGYLTAVNNDRYRNNDSFDLNFITYPSDYTTVRVWTLDEPEFYSEYEKLVMPFDNFTWTLIAIFFIAAFTTILVLYCCVERSTRNFVIDSNVTTPSLNVIRIFFGHSQDIVPRRNFARFLMMMFILYCLIIRTAWQGKMYEFMQKDIEKPGVDTIDEMIELGYFFWMQSNFKEKFPYSEISKRGTVNSVNERSFNRNTFKIATQINSNLFNIGIPLKDQKDTFYKLKKEEVAANICGLKFPRHHPFFEIIDQILQQCFTYKFTDFFFSVSTQWPNANLKRFRTIHEPKVLTMKMLEPGFVIWTLSLLLAVAAFIFEWLITLKDYIITKYILEAFYKTRH